MLWTEILLPGVVAPAVVAAVVLWIDPVLWRRPESPSRPTWSPPLALAAGYGAAHLALSGPPQLPPVETSQWLLVLVLVAGLLSVARAFAGPTVPMRVLSGTLLLFLLWVTLRPMIRYNWTAAESVVWSAALVAAMGGLWLCFARLSAEHSPPHLDTAVAIVVATASGLAIGLSASARLGQLAGSLAAAATAVGVSTALAGKLRGGRQPAAASSAAVLTLALGGLILNGLFYAELRIAAALCLAAAPAGAFAAAKLMAGRGLAAWKQALAGALVALVVTAPAVVLSGVDAARAAEEGYDYGSIGEVEGDGALENRSLAAGGMLSRESLESRRGLGRQGWRR